MIDLSCFAKFLNDIDLICDEYDEDVYHYTSAESAKKILENGKLRFTDRNYLNDYSEGKYVLDLCLKYISSLSDNSLFNNKLKNELEKRKVETNRKQGFFIYQCSLSINGDSLCLWNYYSKDIGIKGYNIRFSTKKLENAIQPQSINASKKNRVYCGRVIYDKERQLEIVADILHQFDDFLAKQEDYEKDLQLIVEYAVDKIMAQGCFFKKNCFEVEEEYRILLNPYIDSNGKFLTIKNKREYCEKNGIFIPYVDIEFSSDCLKGITISPTLDFETTRRGIFDLIADKYPNINPSSIVKSEIPIRY